MTRLKSFSGLVDVVDHLNCVARDSHRAAVQILAAMHCGSGWRNVNDLKLTEGFTYIIRRVNTHTRIKESPVVAVWRNQWEVIPQSGELRVGSSVWDTIQVWI